ncbi:MAG: transposase [bacterium]|nr:transposase [bacterium]
MLRAKPLMAGETYHIYNRGAGKQKIFLAQPDYRRFLSLIFVGNNTKSIHLSNLRKYQGPSLTRVFEEKVDHFLVDIYAYTLMPNHFHLVLRQKSEDGITRFVRRICTAYSMYFNLKYGHNGTLFQGRFKSSHLDTDPYFKWIFPYVHLNPISLVEPQWQEKGIVNPAQSKEFLKNYRYSSYYDYYVGERPERAILAYDEASDLLDKESDFHSMLFAYARGKVLMEL